MDFFDHLVPPCEELFYRRKDPHDLRFGDIVSRDREGYSEAHVIIVGCPQDEGVRRNKGRTGSRHAPREIRTALYRYCVTEVHEKLRVMDIGDVVIEKELEKTHDKLNTVVRECIRDNKKVVVLGGGNDISYPDCSAVSSEVDSLLVFNIDRHLDVRPDQPRNSGTSYRLLMEEGWIEPAGFHEVGIDPFVNSSVHAEYVEKRGAHIHFLDHLIRMGVEDTVRKIMEGTAAEAIFFGFDLDAVSSAEAPGVSAPGPTGLTGREIGEIADLAARDDRTRLVEISEVNPDHDIDGRTSRLAANIIVRALATKSY